MVVVIVGYRFSPLRYWGSLYQQKDQDLILKQFQSPSILGQSISDYNAYWLLNQVLVPFDIGVVYINNINGIEETLLFQSPSILGQSISNIIFKTNGKLGFSPLRYWGSLYPKIIFLSPFTLVLVPFDIGVVYINSSFPQSMDESFSPLRYWGSLYHNDSTFLSLTSFQSPSILGQSISLFSSNISTVIVLVPFDIGVVYIFINIRQRVRYLFQSPSILGQSISHLQFLLFRP